MTLISPLALCMAVSCAIGSKRAQNTVALRFRSCGGQSHAHELQALFLKDEILLAGLIIH